MVAVKTHDLHTRLLTLIYIFFNVIAKDRFFHFHVVYFNLLFYSCVLAFASNSTVHSIPYLSLNIAK